MGKKLKSKPNTDAEYFEYFQQKRWMMTKSIIMISLVSVVGFGLLGYLIDMVLNTKPTFLILLIVISFPVTQIVIHKRLKNKIHE